MISETYYDTVIVGAGPAGCVAAKFAAIGGASVLILEKRPEIGSPVRCGEGIARRWFDDVGIVSDPQWLVHEVKGARIISPGGSRLEIDDRMAGSEVGVVVERDRFDKYLATEAIKAGANIELHTAVTGLLMDGETVIGVKTLNEGKEGEVRCGVVLGADGFESQVGRWGGLSTKLPLSDISTGFQYRLVNVKPDPDYCEFFLDNIVAGGYMWVFPKGSDEANVGIGMLASKCIDPGHPKRLLDKWISENPDYSCGQATEMVSGGVSLSQPLENTVKDGLMLVGDAARMASAMTGGGIANGCVAAKVAGEVIAQAAEAKNFSARFLQKYEVGWRDKLENGLYRDWMAKEKLMTLAPATLDKIVGTLAEVGVGKLSILDILQILWDRHPELVEELQDLL